jgi:hypothetical protein
LQLWTVCDTLISLDSIEDEHILIVSVFKYIKKNIDMMLRHFNKTNFLYLYCLNKLPINFLHNPQRLYIFLHDHIFYIFKNSFLLLSVIGFDLNKLFD